jgi:hypothetical protein
MLGTTWAKRSCSEQLSGSLAWASRKTGGIPFGNGKKAGNSRLFWIESRTPETLKLGRRQVDVPKDTAESADLDRMVAMHGNRGALVAAVQEVMTAPHGRTVKPCSSRKRTISSSVS